jgi:tripartite-type tricarboxylate transporter receptor subunit TctC
MTLTRRRFSQLVAGAAIATPCTARAQAWPARPVRLVIGFAAGGGMDSGARIVASRLSELWGQQVVVENKPGAGGNIAIDTVAHAAPDGYTMLMTSIALAINRYLFPSLGYDPDADFAPVSLIGTYPNLLVVPNSSPAKSVAEFIAYVKSRPGKITYGSPGVGTSPHLCGELFKRRAGIEMTHVPYRGTGAGAMTDLVSGRIDALFNTTGSLVQAARTGQIRALAVTSAQRLSTATEFPTIAESGLPGFDVTSWYALFVPAKTPADIVQRMHAGMATMLSEPEVRTKFDLLGVNVASSTPDQLARRVRAEAELWGPVIKAANIRSD